MKTAFLFTLRDKRIFILLKNIVRSKRLLTDKKHYCQSDTITTQLIKSLDTSNVN